MSYSFTIAGHSSEAHNDKVKEVFEQAVRKLKAMPGSTVSGGGYSNDSSGRVDLKADEVKS